MANSEEQDISDEDSISSALNRQTHRRKFYYVCKEIETPPDGEIASTETELQS